LTKGKGFPKAKHPSTIIESVRYKLRTTKLRAPLDWFRHRGLRTNDVFLASFPRSGNTWMRFLLCEVLTNDVAEFKNVGFAVPDLRYRHNAYHVLPGKGRLIKTHEPFHKEYRRAIYFVRDPRDVIVSCYEFYQTGQSMGDFLRDLLSGKASPHGTWQGHVSSWLNSPPAENDDLLVMHYEDMLSNVESTLRKVLQFLHTPATPEAIRKAIVSNSLENMRAKEDRARATGEGFAGQPIRSRGRRIRIGSIGQWQERLTEAQIQIIEDHAGELLARLGYAPHRELAAVGTQSPERAEQDSADGNLLTELGEASA
jgi:hypothetical protein